MSARPLPVERPASDGTPRLSRVAGAKATGVREELEEMRTLGALRLWVRNLFHESPSWLTSMVVHMILLLVLALLTLPSGVTAESSSMLLSEVEEILIDEIPPLPPDVILPTTDVVFESFEPVTETADFDALFEGPEEFVGPEIEPVRGIQSLVGLSQGDIMTRISGGPDDLSRGRIEEFNRRQHLPEGKAVSAALKWLAEHQLPDGSWSFDHTRCPACGGQCRNLGKLADARLGATALALLPFLGAGQTHQDGIYQATVNRGLYFLLGRMKLDAHGGSFYEPGGRMYSHGIAAIAVCEAFAMTHDKQLYGPAQQALNFIGYAQDPVGGGWRYEPRQRGDTSVVGWQIMALKSGHMAYLDVPPVVIHRASAFLDEVQSESGSQYGYTDAGQGSSATTSIGLLCRMYLGWKKDNPALQRGVQWLAQEGPASGDMYYNYYATQVLRHYGGEPWRQWDSVMQQQLIDAQATAGHETGSWYFPHTHADRGGRLYCTAMAAMTLEVDYRHLPLYAAQSVEDDFVE